MLGKAIFTFFQTVFGPQEQSKLSMFITTILFPKISITGFKKKVRGVWGHTPQKILKFRCLEMLFSLFSRHYLGLKTIKIKIILTGVEPGFFLGGGVPLRNDVTDGEVRKF